MTKVLILGAAGFVGTHLSLALKDKGSIKMLLACRDASKLVDGLESEELRVGDLRDEAYLSTLFDDVDILINLASWSSLFGQKQSSEELFYIPTIDIINRAKKAGVKKYINLSTVSAASSDKAVDANTLGTFRSFWPHLNNVIRIEDHLRRVSNEYFQVINLRCGLFIGKHYALGLLPILLPRLKTHLVPLVKGGNTQMPLIDGEDIARAFVQAALSKKMPNDFEGFNIIGKEVPLFKEVLLYLNEKHKYPYPHFSVPFFMAYPFAGLMELLDPVLPNDPLIVRSIVHLLEDTNTNNKKAKELLGFTPRSEWKEAVDEQIEQMQKRQKKAMKMNKEVM